MSFYIHRTRGEREGWTGPIRSYKQARREYAAWLDTGWDPRIDDSTPDVRRAVREWQAAANKRHGRVRG